MKFSQIVGFVVALSMVVGFSGCDGSSDSEDVKTGTVSLNLTDAPLIDELNVTGVYITVTGIEYHTTDDNWKMMTDFNTSVNPINLLDWQDGESISLGDFQLPSGKYTQIRFHLDTNKSTIEFNGDTNETLSVPSGEETGYKAIGNYDVPVNGTVTITADFDVRKSVLATGNGTYKLKPTIKLVVTEEAGNIAGNVINLEADAVYVVYAYEYEDGLTTWNDEEANDPDPSDSSDIRFENAVTSSAVKDDGSYRLSFLEAGPYDLVVAKYAVDGEYDTVYIENNITVESDETTTHDFTL